MRVHVLINSLQNTGSVCFFLSRIWRTCWKRIINYIKTTLEFVLLNRIIISSPTLFDFYISHIQIYLNQLCIMWCTYIKHYNPPNKAWLGFVEIEYACIISINSLLSTSLNILRTSECNNSSNNFVAHSLVFI